MTRKEAVLVCAGVLLLLAAVAINPWTMFPLLGRNLVRLDHWLVIFAVELALAVPGFVLIARRKTLELASVALAAFSIFLCGTLLLTVDLWLAGREIDRSVTYIENVHVADDRVGWKPKPGTGRHFHKGLFDVTYTIDADGLRKMPGVAHPDFNLFFFGDSFTFGHGVADDKTYPRVIADRYLKNGVNVHNAGVMGYGMTQIYLRFLEFEHRIGPGDVVVLAPLSEDLTRSYATLAQRIRIVSVLLLKSSESGEQVRSYPEFRDGVVESRELPQAVTLYQRLWTRAMSAPVSGALFRVLSGSVAQSQRAVDDSLAMVQLIAERTRARGARFALVFLPKTDECLTHTYTVDVSRFPYLDLMDQFPSDRDGLDRLIFKGDGHWNDDGHRVAAGAMISALVGANLIERRYLRD